MHPNPAFRPRQDDLAALLVREIGFAAIFAATPDGPRVAHAPVVLSADATTLQFHLARGNGLTKHLAGAPALAVVQGPDAYVSANWYADAATAVPTWNYVAVEMEGVARKLGDAELVAQLDTLSTQRMAADGETVAEQGCSRARARGSGNRADGPRRPRAFDAPARRR